jgi:hypothetical protein
MSENIKEEDLKEEVTPASEEKVETEVEVETTTEVETEQDPLKIELEKVRKSGGKTEREKADFTLKKNAERVKELGGDPADILGIKVEEPDLEDEDEKPLTVGMFKKIQQAGATKTAIQLAEEIQDETEKELVKYYLENRIQASGNPQEDLRDARRMVNAVKNEQIITEVKRKTKPNTHSNASGANANHDELKGELTRDEMVFLGKPFNMSKEAILKLRK